MIGFFRSQTYDFHPSQSLPPGFLDLGNEVELASQCKLRFPPRITPIAIRIQVAIRILRTSSKGLDAIVVGRYGEYACLLRGLLGVPRLPLLLVDVERGALHTRAIRGWISRLGHRAIARGAFRVGVFTEEEGRRYAQQFGIPLAKFVWMPYCTGVRAEDYPASEGGHIFSGGNWDRDWPTLFDAIRGLNVEVRIAAARKTVPADIAPPNVTLLGGVSEDEFYRQLASASLVVLSLKDLGLRLPGIRTYVAAMRVGKCVILNDPVGARSYIQDGVTGVLVPPKDPEALRSAIAKLLHNAELRSTIANSARSFAARHFTMEMYFNRIRDVLREVRQ